jgi:phage shock protein C
MVRLYRSQSDRKIGGICGGLAEGYKIDANLIRVGFVFLGLATGGLPLLIAYIVGWIIIPPRPRSA